MRSIVATALAGLVLAAGVGVPSQPAAAGPAAPRPAAARATVGPYDPKLDFWLQNLNGLREHFWLQTSNPAASPSALYHQWELSDGGALSPAESLGGSLSSRITGRRNADGRLEIFGRGAHNDLVHIYQLKAGGRWSGWESLGGVLTSAPAVERNQDERLEVFVRAVGGDFVHIWQLPSGGWSPYASLGGQFAAGYEPWAYYSDGLIYVSGVGVEGPTWMNRQTAPNCCWSGWY
jgi:hypothetical protein